MPSPTRCRSSANKRPASPNAPTTSCAIDIGWTPAPGVRVVENLVVSASPRRAEVAARAGRPGRGDTGADRRSWGDMPSLQRGLGRQILALGCGGSRVDYPRAGRAGRPGGAASTSTTIGSRCPQWAISTPIGWLSYSVTACARKSSGDSACLRRR
jgi:hypothetical protein